MVVLALLLSAQQLYSCGEWFWFPPEEYVEAPKTFERVSYNPFLPAIFASTKDWVRLDTQQALLAAIYEPAQAMQEINIEGAELATSAQD